MSGQSEAITPNPEGILISKGDRPPRRPGFGVVGKKIILKANHFLVTVADRDLHHYDVSILPEVSSKKVCRDIMNEFVKCYKVSHSGEQLLLAYDGRKNCYSAGKLPFTWEEFSVILVDKDDARREQQEFKVTIKFASKANLHHLSEFFKGRQHDLPQATIQCLDVVLREKPSTYCEVVGRSLFHSKFGDGLKYRRGLYQSLRPTQMGLSLNMNTSARPFSESITVTEYVAKYFNNDLSMPLSDEDRTKIEKGLIGVRVEVSHTGHVLRPKILGLTTNTAKEEMFMDRQLNTQTSVADYYETRYSETLKYPHLPAIRVGKNPAKPICFPMEVCTLMYDPYPKKLNESQIQQDLKLVNTEFGITVKPGLTSIEARLLPPPKLKYHESSLLPNNGKWNMIDQKMVNGGVIKVWGCINFSNSLQDREVKRFLCGLIKMCCSRGMVFNPNPLFPTRHAPSNQIEKTLCDIGVNYSGIELLIIILPDTTGSSYGTIKKICETEIDIVSQCCQPIKALNCKGRYLESVSLKINVKVGGRNFVLEKMPCLTDRPTIIFGADVTHHQPGEDSSPSIAAVVASMDWPEVTKYRCLVSAQKRNVEIIQGLYEEKTDPKTGVVGPVGMIRDHILAFYNSTGRQPEQKIFYRDGVGEGQFNQVLLNEVTAIRKACLSIEENYMPRITFIVVQKRHHTRLFPAKLGDSWNGNIKPGTVVDTKICHPTEFDFYLCSHAAIHGTSRPIHYHVLFDENSFTADGLQVLTNSLCYTFARCTSSISIVPPVYYAHLAASRARYYLDDAAPGGGTRDLRQIKDNVKKVMFYC